MIIAALDTGMRRGGMLALRFGDIDWKRRMITLRGATTKSRRTRLVPVGTARLLAVLEWLRLDSNGWKEARRSIRRPKLRTDFQESFKITEPGLRSKRRPRQGIRYKSLNACSLESWYRYGDSNPGPVAENHVS